MYNPAQSLMNLGFSLLPAIIQQQQADQANKEQKQIIANLTGGWQGLGGDISQYLNLNQGAELAGILQGGNQLLYGGPGINTNMLAAAGTWTPNGTPSATLPAGVGGAVDASGAPVGTGGNPNLPQAMQGLLGQYNWAMGQLDSLSDQQKKDINTGYAALGAQQQQMLANSGLTGTSVMPSMAAGINRQRQEAQNRLADQIMQERLQTGTTLSSNFLNAQDATNQRLLSAYNSAYNSRIPLAFQVAGNVANTQLLGMPSGPPPVNFGDVLQGWYQGEVSSADQRLQYDRAQTMYGQQMLANTLAGSLTQPLTALGTYGLGGGFGGGGAEVSPQARAQAAYVRSLG